MNVVFKKIKLNNFFSFKHTELDLMDMGNTLVIGRNHCKLDNAYSNGSGKSSIFNGICFALTGETAQGISNGIENIFGNPDNCWVELTFEADGNEFVIRRIKTPKPDLKITINGEDHSGKGIRESSKILANYLPDLTSELIGSVIVLGQGMPHRFTNNNPAGRKEILEKLTKSDFMIQSIKDKLESRQNDLKTTLRLKEDELLSATSQLEVYEKQYSSYESDLKEYESYSDIQALIDETTLCVEAITIGKLSSEKMIIELESKVNGFNAERSNILSNSNKELSDKLIEVEKDIVNITSELNEATSDKKLLEKEIKKLDAITDICPTCGQKIPEVNKPDTTEKKASLKELSNNVKKLTKKLDNLNDNKSKIKTEHDVLYSTKLEELNNSITENTNLIKRERENVFTAVNKLNDLSNKIFKLKSMQDNYNKLVSNMEETKSTISSLYETVSNKKIEISDLNGHISVVQQMITLAKREFRGVLLSNIIEFINKKVKQYSRAVFGTEELSFTLNENAIDITYCGKLYENLSGGEKQKIDVIVQLALRDILNKQLNTRFNLLICDEIYDNMDSISCQKITNLISNLTDIDSIFVISHHAQDLEITYDNQLLVEKNENGISSICFV